jgi:Rps23 Pro-64 3,4-dihydroxylase Tpa1-like proline 4-hydroxylase
LRGLYVYPPGAFQALHRDFRRHPVTGMFHRVTVLVFLNSDWHDDYGGEFELWTKGGKECVRRIAPAAGTVVIFEPSPDALHGIPDPIRCPSGRARLSLTSSYFAPTPAPGDRRDSLLFRPKRPEDPWYMRFVTLQDGIGKFQQIVQKRRATRV